jgi:hypothetical protein
MDELNLLRDLHRAIPGPSAAEAARARAQLLTAMGDPRSAAPRRLVTARRLAFLKRLARPRLWAPVGAAAAVTAVVITAVTITAAPGPLTSRPSSARPKMAAAYALNEAASAAARQIPGHGQFFATEVELISPAGPSAKPSVATVWWGSSAVWMSGGGPALTGFPHGLEPPYMAFPSTFLDQVQQLPDSPVPLLADLAKMTRGIPGPTTFVEFWAVCIILAYFPASPALRAALYRAAATLPGLRLATRARDPLGRVGAEVYGLSGTTGQLVSSEIAFFDPSSGALLDYEEYRVGKAPAKPQCNSLSIQIALLASGYVGSRSQLPPGAPLSPKPVAQAAVRGCPSVGGPQPTAPARSRS